MIAGDTPANSAACADWAREHLPGLRADAPAHSYRCPYTSTEDGEWIVGRHPAADDVFIAAAFSGEGFKFAPAVGEAIADLALGDPERV
eukprot:gene46941-26616_t